MSFKALLAAAAVVFALPAFAHDGVHVSDAYARVSGPTAKSGAIFLKIENHATEPDRLVSVASDVAVQTELHTHKESADGVMQMLKVEEGFPVPAGETHALARGGDHVMLLGLNRSLSDGDVVHLTLTFERGQVIEVDVPVDSKRADAPMDGMGTTGGMDHGTHSN